MSFLRKKKYRSVSVRSGLLLMSLFLTGCAAVGPDYAPPKTSPPSSWHSALAGGLAPAETTPQGLAAWWNTLGDPKLSGLIERAAAGNLDLREAEARVREARARRALAGADYYPTLDASGKVNRSRGSGETGTGRYRNLYTAGFDAGWELDLFGGVRRAVEAAEADLQAEKEDLRNVLVSLLAEVALNYVEVRKSQARLTVALANLTAQEETWRLTGYRFEAGLSDELALHQARYNLENTRSQIPSIRSDLESAENRIAVLLGEQPGKLHRELEVEKPIPVIPVGVAVGVPAEVLRRRPDVRRAERQLAASTARIGEAQAELYPKFNLSGSIGLEALASGRLLTAAARTLSLGAGISWKIFDAGALRRNVEIKTALQEQALARYEAVILTALEEVENALTAYAQEQHRLEALEEATRAAKRAADLAQDKYQAGISDFGVVLEAQRSLLSFQDQLAQSKGTVTSNLIRLYKVLGGGWTAFKPDPLQQEKAGV